MNTYVTNLNAALENTPRLTPATSKSCSQT
jgi:hypothetical protein